MKRKHNQQEITIKVEIKKLKALGRKVNLWNAEAVRNCIQDAPFKGGHKNSLGYVYSYWCEYQGFNYKPQNFRRDTGLPYVPLEKEVDQLIGVFAHSKYGALLQLLKETGFRPIEALRLTPKDFNFESQTVTLNSPAKGSNPRQLKISDKLVSMLKQVIRGKRIDELVWKTRQKGITRTFERNRQLASEKLGNPNLQKISLKTFRHFKATMEYHRTKDILYVQKILGHKNIQNTMVYTHLVQWESQDNFTCRIAKTIEEVQELIEGGFEYVTDFQEAKIFRKRK